MKKLTLFASALFALFIISNGTASAQTAKKKQTVTAKSISTPNAAVTKLTHPVNDKAKPAPKSRGDIYGPNYSDIVIGNNTGYNIDIYVDGSYRGTIGAYDTKTTWAIPGSTNLYAKATFTDGSYKYWGPFNAYTGYEYTWNLFN